LTQSSMKAQEKRHRFPQAPDLQPGLIRDLLLD
jgi:hypothetical protein